MKIKDFTRRTMRTWAICQLIYALILAILVSQFVPWKTPLANLLVLLYALLHAAGGHGLWRLRTWGWRLSLVAGILGLVAAVVVCSALVASWAYLRTVFGDFGRGASLAALLFASIALQLLGLFPALQVRALLRREVRSDMGAGAGLVRAVFGLALIPLVLTVCVFFCYSLNPLPPVSQEGREQTLTYLRAVLEEHDVVSPSLDALRGIAVGVGPLQVTLWHQGRAFVRVSGEGDDLAVAVREAGAALAKVKRIDFRARLEGRLKVDRIVSTAPVASEWGPVLALSVNPGQDGLRRCHAGDCRILLADDLVRDRRFGKSPLIPGIREIRFGLHTEPVLRHLELDGGQLERIRTESWVEYRGQALDVVRGNTSDAKTGAGSWREAAISGGDFILRQIRDDGRFHYIYQPLTNRHRGGAYSLPRHAGTVYALALLYGHTTMKRFRVGAERAIEWLGTKIPDQCGSAKGTCVVRGSTAQLGSSALTVVGMLEYQRRTRDTRYAETSRQLVEFILDMQRPDGDFHHIYHLQKQQVDAEDRRMFASEEAALALVMAHEVLGDDRYLRAAARALDYLTGPKYETSFLGRFIYGADHWTCIAAEEAYPRLRSRQYLDFCQGYAAFIRRIQYQPGEWNNADFTGHYGFGAIMLPQAPAAAGFTEAIISTAELAAHHGAANDTLREQVALGLDALTRDQLREANSYMMKRPLGGYGGIRRSLVEQEIRIDFTQHAASALIRGAAMERSSI